ncbi:BAG family molecular chaperone regulator 3-like isoform X2 [Rhododendron vialii]|uniref:BAG family molecular chaperone regulator 3-like isoform X2 n=1 Tax=Rhododendron vialii TaxID=182163 RepID=UPI00265DA56B|nr:BAG family molecular chaperone regulator 3-like isoform X2 [Rhododendron vialii]
MMRMKTKTTPPPPTTNGSSAAGEWEVRPGGMLVQKRTDSDQTRIPPPTIRVRVKYGSVYHEVNISSQASFGELKKMLSGPTGLHHEDQKLMYKDKERDSKQFLDIVGVKDRSKMVLVEDPISQEKRYLAMKKTAKMEKASKSISDISLDVDRLAGQVSALESVIYKGGKVEEKMLLNLIEMLMNQLIKLDGIVADGDVKLQRKMQVRRVQKYVEILDVLKVKNSTPTSNGSEIPQQPSPVQQNQPQRRSNGEISSPNQPKYSNGQISPPTQQPKYSNVEISSPNQQPSYSKGQISSPNKQHQPRHSVGHSPIQTEPQPQQPSRHSASGAAVVITTQWETFDPAPPSTSNAGNPVHPKFNWGLLE